jgi:HD-GYP domain-containing protein (c-di-GMP phosphodiesterase class II)
MSFEDACKELEDGAGTQFDPDVVAAFMRLAPTALQAHPV